MASVPFYDRFQVPLSDSIRVSEQPEVPDGEPAAQPALVVRGGSFEGDGMKAALNNAKAVHAEYGRWGLCVASGPGMTVEEGVRGRPIRNGKLSLSDTDRLADAGYEVTHEPGFEEPTASIIWLPDGEVETLQTVAALFDAPTDSPLTAAERRDL